VNRRLAVSRLVLTVTAVVTMGCATRETSGGEPAPGITTYPTGRHPRSVAVADLDGDGRRDVVVANSGDGTVQVFVGTASGRLQAPTASLPAGNEPSDVDVVDVDQDGDGDLAVANHETSLVTLLLNDGEGGFAPAPASPLESDARPHVHGLATGDFDGDGWNDIAVESADTREVRVLRGGSAGFAGSEGVAVGTMPYYRIGAVDLTGDGPVEILVPGHRNNSALVIGQGRDVLAGLTTSLSAQPWMVVGDDVNGDGRADLVVVLTDGVAVLLAGPERFEQAPGSPFFVARATEVATGDLDGDGIADVVVGPWEGGEVTILRGGTFARQSARVCERPTGLAVADLDGDRRGELIVACATEDRMAVVTDAMISTSADRPADPVEGERRR
jgi:hypothetical protein